MRAVYRSFAQNSALNIALAGTKPCELDVWINCMFYDTDENYRVKYSDFFLKHLLVLLFWGTMVKYDSQFETKKNTM